MQIPAKAELLMEVVSRKLFHRKRPFATAAQRSSDGMAAKRVRH